MLEARVMLQCNAAPGRDETETTRNERPRAVSVRDQSEATVWLTPDAFLPNVGVCGRQSCAVLDPSSAPAPFLSGYEDKGACRRTVENEEAIF